MSLRYAPRRSNSGVDGDLPSQHFQQQGDPMVKQANWRRFFGAFAVMTILGVAATCLAAGAPKKKTTPPPPPPTTGPAAAPFAAGSLFSLRGSSGLPKYLMTPMRGFADAEGIRTEIRSVDTHLGAQDFTLDVLLRSDNEESGKGKGKSYYIGVGEGKSDQSHLKNSVYVKVDGDGAVTLAADKIKYEMGKLAPGTHLVRLTRTGNDLVAAIIANYKGLAAPTLIATFPDLAKNAAFLSKDASLFMKGEATWSGVSLAIAGKPVETGVDPAAARPPPAPAALISLGQAKKLPDGFVPLRDVTFDKEGLDMNEARGIRTRTGDFINRNFTLDVVYSFESKNKQDKPTITIGLGDGGRVKMENDAGKTRRGSERMEAAVAVQLHGADATFKIARPENAKGKREGSESDLAISKEGPGEGPHMVRMQKRGDTLTVFFQPNYHGQFTPTHSKTLLSLSREGFLDAKNSFVFLQAEHGLVHQMQLTADGEQTMIAGGGALVVPEFAAEGQAIRQLLYRDPKAGAGRQFALNKIYSAPNGLAISPQGELTWTPTHDQIGHQTFRIDITANGQTTTEEAAIDVVSAEDAKAAGGDLKKVATMYQLALESPAHEVVPGLNGTLLLLEGDQLRRLGADGLAVTQTLKLPRPYTHICERADLFIAYSAKEKVVDLIDKQTLKVRTTAAAPYQSVNTLTPDPKKAVTYLGASYASPHDNSPIVVLDEKTGTLQASRIMVGSYAAISPDGGHLYTAIKELIPAGREFNLDIGQWMTTYQDMSKLLIYDLRQGQPFMEHMIGQVGANCAGLALSPDGKRVSYLSFTGFPSRDCVPAWDTAHYDQPPAAYQAGAQGRGDHKHIAFNPMLPLAAAPGKAPVGVLIFDRETGVARTDAVGSLALENGTKIENVFFSPDGRSVILDCDQKGSRYLRKVKLTLTAAEQAALAAKKQ